MTLSGKSKSEFVLQTIVFCQRVPHTGFELCSDHNLRLHWRRAYLKIDLRFFFLIPNLVLLQIHHDCLRWWTDMVIWLNEELCFHAQFHGEAFPSLHAIVWIRSEKVTFSPLSLFLSSSPTENTAYLAEPLYLVLLRADNILYGPGDRLVVWWNPIGPWESDFTLWIV